MKRMLILKSFLIASLLTLGLLSNAQKNKTETKKLSVIFDTDANNDLDDQHAMAYLFFNSSFFDTKAITVNATESGGDINQHYQEAERIMKLCKVADKIPLLKGANGSFTEIETKLSSPNYDGFAAVDFIITEAKKHQKDKLIVIAVGKLTNMALALKKDPSISKHIRLVWLGGNYPEPGEYNLMGDIPSMNYVLQTNIEFEMVTVRYGKTSGTDAVSLTKNRALENMKGAGPIIDTPIIGRHGGSFNRFGDYSINLFEHVEYYGNPPSRALFDMAAVAIIKNKTWAKSFQMACPIMIEKNWVEQPNNIRKITVWEYFDKEKILQDFFYTMKHY